jgi:hypothetical protein
MSESAWSQRSPIDAFAKFVGVPFRRQTYRNLAYLLLALPLGIAYFTVITTGLSTGLSLVVTLVGIPIIVGTLAVALGIGSFEAQLAGWLLDVDISRSPPDVELAFGSVEEIIATTKRVVTTPATWTGLLHVGLKFVFGIVAFTAVVTAGSISVALLSLPIFYDASGVTYTLGPYVVDTLAEALVGAGCGVVLLLVSLHVLNGLARFGGFLTNALLSGSTTAVTGDPNV